MTWLLVIIALIVGIVLGRLLSRREYTSRQLHSEAAWQRKLATAETKAPEAQADATTAQTETNSTLGDTERARTEANTALADVQDLQSNTEPAAPEAAAASFVAPAEPQPRTDVSDDPTKIEGIGPKIAELLNGSGVTTFEGLAASSVERLREIGLGGGNRFRMHDPSTWPERGRARRLGELGRPRSFTGCSRRRPSGVTSPPRSTVPELNASKRTAVGLQRGAGDVRRGFGHEEHSGSRELLRLPITAERDRVR